MMHLSPGQNPRKMTDKEVKDWRMEMLRMQTENLNQSLGNRFSFHSRSEDYSADQRMKDDMAYIRDVLKASGYYEEHVMDENRPAETTQDADFEVVSSKIKG